MRSKDRILTEWNKGKMVPFLEEICMSNKKMKRVKLAAVSITKKRFSSLTLIDSHNSSSFPSSFQIKVSPFFALLLHLRFSFLLVFFSHYQWQKGRSKPGLFKSMCECDLEYNYHFSSLSTSTNPPFHSFNFQHQDGQVVCLASLKTLH